MAGTVFILGSGLLAIAAASRLADATVVGIGTSGWATESIPADVIDADSAEIALAEAARRFGTPCHVIIDADDLP